MTDDRLLRAFRTFDAPVEPDTAFAERLFEDLATELGFRRDVVPAATLRGRLLRALGVERLPIGAPALRLAYLAAVLGLLLVALAAALLIGSPLLDRRPSPLDLVRMSQEAYADAPAVRMTIRDANGESLVLSDGRGTWRSESWGETRGSYFLYDGTRVGYFDATVMTWSLAPVEEGGPPFPFDHEFTWTQVDYPGLVATLSTVPCADATELGETTIAGRTADGIGCPGIGMEYWIDRETRLVLRTVAAEGSPFWVGPVGEASVIEATAFEELAATATADFAWSGPSDSQPPDSPLASTVLVVGERPPPWSGRTIDGQEVASDDLPTPAAVLLIAPGCPRCTTAYDDFTSIAPTITGLSAAVVGVDESAYPSGFVAGFARDHPTDIPVVSDQGSVSRAWGITGLPALVLVGPDGAVVGMFRTRMTRADLERVLSAAAGGLPIPSVAPAPAPTAIAGDPSMDPSVTCSEELATCMPIGSRMPDWSLPLMQGGSIGSADLAGKPSVIVFTGFRCDGPCPEWVLGELDAFAAMIEEYRGRATFIIVSDGEIRPGDTQALFREAGVDIPLVFDWDGSLSTRFLLIVGSALVFDGEGRYVDHLAFPGIAAGARAILDPLVAGPSPATSP